MKLFWFSTVFLAITVAVPVHAQVYKWKDASGQTVISDTPQPGSGKPVVRPPANGAPAATQEAPKSLADQEMDFKKRQQTQQEAAAKAAQDQTQANSKQANCERVQKNKAMLESGQRMRTMGPDGKPVYIDDQQRQQEIDRANKALTENCQ
ncbi:MAG: DUF4124 domain-containing protein [Zoogloeaceae bacterium]|jgi:hypothetical protein|nr:DUF4124 domain-containing protein [Zoogloeaceae bacterium]